MWHPPSVERPPTTVVQNTRGDGQALRFGSVALGLLGLALVFGEVGVGVFGWAVLCLLLGALAALLMLVTVALAVCAVVVCVIPWALTGAAALSPARVFGDGGDAAGWIFRAWLHLGARAFGHQVHLALTPMVAAGLVLGGVSVVGFAALAVQRRRAR